MTVQDVPGAFPTVDVPDHAHYTIGVVILIVGITGTLGNFLVIYAFCRYPSFGCFFKILESMNFISTLTEFCKCNAGILSDYYADIVHNAPRVTALGKKEATCHFPLTSSH